MERRLRKLRLVMASLVGSAVAFLWVSQDAIGETIEMVSSSPIAGELAAPVELTEGDKYADGEKYDKHFAGSSDYCPPWTIWAWTGPTYYDTGADSEAGFAYGANAGYRLWDGIGVYGGVGLNHIEGATQTLGTLGVQKFGNPCGGGIWDHTTAWLLWDHLDRSDAADTQDQLRLQLGYVFHDQLEVGLTGTGGGDGAAGGLLPIGGPATAYVGSDYIGGYLNTRLNRADIGLTLGHTDATDELLFGVNARVCVTDRSNVGVDVFAGDDSTFAGMIFYEIGFGRRDTRRY